MNEARLILADSETASLEPLGLSEVILYVYLLAESLSRQNLRLRAPALVTPVAFSLLDTQQCRALVDAALQFCDAAMKDQPKVIRAAKLKRAERALRAMLETM